MSPALKPEIKAKLTSRGNPDFFAAGLRRLKKLFERTSRKAPPKKAVLPKPLSAERETLLFFAAAAAMLLVPYFLSVRAGPDLWWHVKVGIDILKRPGLVMVDRYSYTVQGMPWINHEWLSDALFGGAFLLRGDQGLLILRGALLALFTACFVKLLWSRAPVPVYVLGVLACSLPVLTRYLNVRPQTFSYLFLAVSVLIIEACRKGKTAWAWWLVPLMLVWANCHGGFVLGLAYGVSALAGFVLGINGMTRKLKRAEKTRAAVVTVLMLLVPLVNPYGLKLYGYLFKELGADHGAISEWAPVGGKLLWIYLAFALVPAAVLFATRTWRRKSEILFFFLSAAAAGVHRRFLVLAVFFGMLVLSEGFFLIWQRQMARRKAPALAALTSRSLTLALMLLVFPWSLFQTSAEAGRHGLRLAVHDLGYPVGAVEYLKQKPYGPNLGVAFQWGGYALWHLYPRYRVSADGRNLTVYPRDYMAKYLDSYRKGDLKLFFEPKRADALLIENAGPMYEAAARSLVWQEVYRDDIAAVFVPISKII